MKRRMMMMSIAVAGLLLCVENVQAQSRVVTRTRPENVAQDDRYIERDDPRRTRHRADEPAMKPVRAPRPVDTDVVRAFERERFDPDRLRMSEMIFSTGGLMTTEQIARIARIFDYDSNRVKFLKLAYGNCIDRYNYYMVLPTLDFSSSREKIMDFVYAERVRDYREKDVYYKVSTADFNAIVRLLKKESFDSTRNKLGRMIICGTMFTARQIADMAKTFIYDSNRYDFLLDAFDNCVDQQNYYIAINTLNFESNRDKLMTRLMRRR